jgi:hypothetical protein
MKRSEVKVPEKFTGIAAEAYVDGYLAGHNDQVLNATTVGFLSEFGTKMLDEGINYVLTAKGVREVARSTRKKLGRNAELAHRIAKAAQAVRDIGRKP